MPGNLPPIPPAQSPIPGMPAPNPGLQGGYGAPKGRPQQNPWTAILALMGQHQSSGYNPMAEANADIARLGALRHDLQGDANRAYAPGTMNQGNPFANGFFNQSAGNLDHVDPRIAQSQGGTAMNQLVNPIQYPGMIPPTMSNAQAAAQASPSPFQISPESQGLVHGYPNQQSMMPRPKAQSMSGSPRPGFSFSALR